MAKTTVVDPLHDISLHHVYTARAVLYTLLPVIIIFEVLYRKTKTKTIPPTLKPHPYKTVLLSETLMTIKKKVLVKHLKHF